MSKSFLQTLSQAKELSAQEQLALIAILSRNIALDQISSADNDNASFEGFLPKEDQAKLIARIEAYEKGELRTISGKDFREELKKKYGS